MSRGVRLAGQDVLRGQLRVQRQHPLDGEVLGEQVGEQVGGIRVPRTHGTPPMIAKSITMRSMTGHGNRAADHLPTRNPRRVKDRG